MSARGSRKRMGADLCKVQKGIPFDKSVPQFLKCVIPRKGYALTWESPGTMFDIAVQGGKLYQEIATSLRSSQ